MWVNSEVNWGFFFNLGCLKKIATILLLGILMFNLVGYRLLVTYMQDRMERNMVASLDGNRYDESQLVSVKLPISHLSYYNADSQFERVDGSVELSGVQYRYVKRRIYNDSLEFLCLPDREATALKAFKSDFDRLVNGFQGTHGKHHGGNALPHRHPAEDPYLSMDGYIGHTRPCKQLSMTYYQQAFLPSPATASDERPPAFFC
jgi:hypothetical protein